MKASQRSLFFLLVTASTTLAFSQTVLIGTNEYTVVFADSTLPQNIQVSIAAELTEAFSYGSSPSDIYETQQA